jgi:TolB-like protein
VTEISGSDQVNGSPTTAPQAALAPNSNSAVFISYASQDAAIADALCAALEQAGIACWIAPRNVRPGDFYADAIVNAINACPVLVLVLSKNSVDSAHVLREVERASAKKRPVIAFRIDTTPLPPGLEYFLSASQWIDASSGTPERRFPKLVEALRDRSSSTPKAEAGRPTVLPPGKKSLNAVVVVATAVVAAALLLFAIDKLRLSNRAKTEQAAIPVTSGPAAATPAVPAIPEKSIAVLPFTDMSEKKDQEYFADGIAEEVLDRLAQVPGLKVVGRASSFQFKDKSADPASIGAALGVAYLLEGSVRRDAGRVRVAAQLVEARTGSQRWSDHFDSDVIDVLQVQDTVAAEIARKLQLSVEVDTAPRSSVASPQVVDAYLRGRQSLDHLTRESSAAGVANFQQALSLDPTFAPAAIGLAKAYGFIGLMAWVPTPIAFERAREAARLAQRLEPRSPSPHISLAEIHLIYDWDWDGANQELQTALALGPRDSFGARTASRLAATRGHWDEARQLAGEAIALDPLDAISHWSFGYEIYLRSGQFAEAEQSFRRALQIEPEMGSGHFNLGLALMLQGRLKEAIVEYGKEKVADGQLEGLSMAYFATGHKVESDAKLAEAIRVNRSDWPSEIARVYAFRGERNAAFEWLDRAYDARDETLYVIKDDPLLKNIEGDPRYKAFLKKMNLPE